MGIAARATAEFVANHKLVAFAVAAALALALGTWLPSPHARAAAEVAGLAIAAVAGRAYLP